MSAEVEAAEAEVRAAREVLRVVEHKIREAKEAAARSAALEFKSALLEAQENLTAASRAKLAVQDLAPDHPWTGMRVFAMKPQGKSYARRPDLRVEGIVETRKSSTSFPGNVASYTLPMVGEGFVRLLKKDESTGLKFARMDRSSRPWKLVDGART